MGSSLDSLRTLLKRRRLDALLVTQPENRRYLSNYSASDTSIQESSGALLIPVGGAPFLFTDFRYQLQAESEATGFEVMLYKRGLLSLLKKLLPTLSVKRFAFESHSMLHSTALAMTSVAEKLGIELVATTGLIEKRRAVKEEEEARKIRESVQLNEAVFKEAYVGLRPGQTEREVALRIETLMRTMGAEGPAFETIVASGPNGALPHAVPTDRALREGEPIIIDMGLKLDGYCSDMTRTVVLGRPDEKTTKHIRLVRKAQLTAVRELCAGVFAKDVDGAARDVIKQAGLGDRFGHGLGHGVGLAVHEAPSLNRRNRKKLKAGMVVTVEPGIYLPGWGGVRLENMAVVQEGGCLVLNNDTTFLDI